MWPYIFLKNKDKQKQNIYAVKTSSTVYVRLSYEWGGNFDTIYSVKSYHETKLPWTFCTLFNSNKFLLRTRYFSVAAWFVVACKVYFHKRNYFLWNCIWIFQHYVWKMPFFPRYFYAVFKSSWGNKTSFQNHPIFKIEIIHFIKST